MSERTPPTFDKFKERILAPMNDEAFEKYGRNPRVKFPYMTQGYEVMTIWIDELAEPRKRWYDSTMLRHFTNFIRKVIIMATLADQVIALTAAVTALDAKVSTIQTGAPADLTPVLTAVAGVDADVKEILAQVTPTPAS